MKVAVIGAGAVGLGLASCLLESGMKVRLVVRSPRQRAALEREGIRRSGLFGSATAHPRDFDVTDSLEAGLEHDDDFWLICVKSSASHELARRMGPIWLSLPGRDDEKPRIVLCQNGWGNAEIFAEVLPREAIFNARVITGFVRSSETEVDITVHADAIRIGSLWGADDPNLDPLCRAIQKGGIPCEPSAAIEKDLWAKLLYNSLLNPLGALVGVPYGDLAKGEATRRVMEAVAREVFAVMDASGFATHWRSAEEYLETFYAQLLPPTARHQSSMLQDLRAGRTTEIDSICGVVGELGEEYGVATPVNDALARLIRVAESRDLRAAAARA
jgi:2-dehydropantoate 2-reductase